MKDKLLCILHRSPPHHGAANIGDFIAGSSHIKESSIVNLLQLNHQILVTLVK